MALVSVVDLDCCTRVFSRSSGCSSTEDVRPEMNPDTRCDLVDFLTTACGAASVGASTTAAERSSETGDGVAISDGMVSLRFYKS